jgi:hypothetical protein
MRTRKTWQEKLDNGRDPKVVRLEKNFGGIPAGSEMLVSTPREVDALLRQVPSGQLVTLDEIRNKLAAKHGADGACPMSTAMFLRIACEAAWEQIDQGQDPGQVTPFWRAVPPDSPLAEKLTCGEAFLRKMQRQEGISSSTRGGSIAGAKPRAASR